MLFCVSRCTPTALAILLSVSSFEKAACAETDVAPVEIQYYYETGCHACSIVSNQVLPSLKERYGDFCTLLNNDVGIQSNYVSLAQWQNELHITDNEPVCMIVDGRFALSGLESIRTGLFARLDQCIEERLAGEHGTKAVRRPSSEVLGASHLLQARLKSFSLPIILAAGFLEGFNPCAISSLVFFISLLSLSKARERGILLLGLAFCVASFVTYTAIGFGLFRVVYLWSGFPIARRAIETALSASLLLLSVLSFRDAYRVRRSGNFDNVVLQLPERLKTRIHEIMKKGVAVQNLAFGGAMVGVVVTALESVCTGQMYLPTLVLIAKSGVSTSRVWCYIVAYNLMFIMPLAAAFIAVFFGLRGGGLAKWNRRHVVVGQILMGALFLLLAVLIILF